MQIQDSRTTWRDYWSSRPRNVQLVTMALLAGLIAIYAVMVTLAVFGVWRHNLFRLNTNWPWSMPLAALSLLGYRFGRPVLVHVLVFAPLLALLCLMAASYVAAGRLDLVWYSPVGLLSVGIANVLAFRWLSKMVDQENEEGVPSRKERIGVDLAP